VTRDLPAPHPAPLVELVDGIHVVRDDALAGGSKRRFIDVYIARSEAREFIYASPAYGGAQIALAHAARAAARDATVFVAARSELHPRSLEAQAAGARIVQVPHGYLSNVQAKAKAYAAERGDRELLPFGFEIPEATTALSAAAAQVRRELGAFDEVWCAVGSGMLLRSLMRSGLGATYFGVAIGREAGDAFGSSATIIRHPQPFASDVRPKLRPPFPSCSNYDAKVWQHAKARRVQNWPSRMLFWNVMR
jgi:hypothetical protein